MDTQYLFQWYWVAMKDCPGFIVPYAYAYPTRWSFYLAENFPLPLLRQFTRNKFYLYDEVDCVSAESDYPKERMLRLFAGQDGPALISGECPRQQEEKREKKTLPIAVDEETAELKVSGFNPNRVRIQVDLRQGKFLVYTDNYHRGWKAHINGRPAKVYRANVAFQGIWLPAGKSSAEFRFEPPGGGAVYFALIVLFAVFFLWVAGLHLQEFCINSWKGSGEK